MTAVTSIVLGRRAMHEFGSAPPARRGSRSALRFRPMLQRLEDRTAPAAGMLDPTFGVGGRVTTPIGIPSDDSANGTAIDSLGRIVAVGGAYNGSDFEIEVARFMPAGALDPSFGAAG